jgi:hypothetical protein
VNAEKYSHSMRRGFEQWVTKDWDIKTPMEYVGWKNLRSAMRYIDAAEPFHG